LTVQQELASLEELQILDLQNFTIRKELEAIPATIEEKRQNVEFVRTLLQKERARLDEAEAWRANSEREIQMQGDMLNNSRTKLQGARNEKENKAAQREIDTLRKNIGDREKEALEMLEAIEQYRIAIDEHTKEFAQLEETLRAEESSGNERIAELNALIAESAQKRAELASRVPEPILRRYDRVQKKLGRGLVEVIDGFCSGCNIGILPQLFNELIRGEKIHACPSCTRILIYRPRPENSEGSKD